MITTFQPSAWYRLLSYLWPIRIHHGYSKSGDYLELLLYRNQWQLATEDALYSDGRRYAPFRLAFKNLPNSFFRKAGDCLILGTGLGSVAQILHHRYNAGMHYTLVELNGEILKWATTVLALSDIRHFRTFPGDAFHFMESNTDHYDLICIDVFIGRSVPERILQPSFLGSCQKALRPGGYCIMNYIIHENEEWENLQRMLSQQFHTIEILTKGKNRILICQHL